MVPQHDLLLFLLLAVSTRTPDGANYFEFCRPLWASVRSFISIHQVTAATALLLLILQHESLCQV